MSESNEALTIYVWHDGSPESNAAARRLREAGVKIEVISAIDVWGVPAIQIGKNGTILHGWQMLEYVLREYGQHAA